MGVFIFYTFTFLISAVAFMSVIMNVRRLWTETGEEAVVIQYKLIYTLTQKDYMIPKFAHHTTIDSLSNGREFCHSLN
jgi:hypothetical protein